MGMFDGLLGAAGGTAGLFQGGAQMLGSIWSTGEAEKEAQANREFQQGARATQYQTAVNDLKAAGLNPMLAYTQGGAGNLSGAVATPSGNPGEGFANAQVSAERAAQVKNLAEQNANIQQQTATGKAQEEKARAEAGLTQTLAAKAFAEIPNVVSSGSQINELVKNLRAERDNLVATLADLQKRPALTVARTATEEKRPAAVVAGTEVSRAQAALTTVNARLAKLEERIQTPEAEKADTFFGKHISPYLPDVLKSVSSAAGGAGLYKLFGGGSVSRSIGFGTGGK